MLDFVSLALIAILALLAISIYLVKVRRRYSVHKRLQLGLGATLAVAVMLFELDIRFVTDWQARAASSPYFAPGRCNIVWSCLVLHLICAVPTLLLWCWLIAQAWRRFPRPPGPCAYSRLHARLGWLASLGMLLTALTGWLFYWLAFVAS
jgi:putative membrane protein